MGQRHAQKFGSHFQVMIGLERIVSARPHVVQHEDRSDAREHWSQQMMSAAEIQRLQPGANDGVAELLHRVDQPTLIVDDVFSRKRLKKRLSEPPARGDEACALFPV
jgi:hypothetical protein